MSPTHRTTLNTLKGNASIFCRDHASFVAIIMRSGIYPSGRLPAYATTHQPTTTLRPSRCHDDDDDEPMTGYDERFMAPISSAAFYAPGQTYQGGSLASPRERGGGGPSNYNRFLGHELGVGGNVHAMDGAHADAANIFPSGLNATASPGRQLLSVGISPTAMSPAPRQFNTTHENDSLMEPTPGMQSQTGMSTPRCSTPTGQSSHDSCTFSSPPQFRHQPAKFHSASPPQAIAHSNGDDSNWSTPFKKYPGHSPAAGSSPFITREMSPLGHLFSPPPQMQTPFSTPVRRLAHSLSPVLAAEQSPLQTPSRTSGGAPSGSAAAVEWSLPPRTPPLSSHYRILPPAYRKQKSLNASRVLDGSGLVHDPHSQPIGFGRSAQLFAALQTTVFQWNPAGVVTLVNAASVVTAVTASHQGDCVHQYAAIGISSGLLHLFELDGDGNVTAQLVDNQFTKRIAAMAIYDDTLYVADVDGIMILMNLAQKFSLPFSLTDGSLETSFDNVSPPPARKRKAQKGTSTSTAQRRSSGTASYYVSPTSRCALHVDPAPPPLPPRHATFHQEIDERIDFGCRVYSVEITDDGNHIAVGCEKGLYVLHRTQPVPKLLDGSAPVHHVSWASASLGMGLVAYVRGPRGTVIVVRSLSGGVQVEHETNWEILSMRCCRTSPECVVSHGDRLDMNGRVQIQPLRMNTDISQVTDEGGDEQCDEHLVIYDMQGSRLRKTTRLTGHRSPVHCMVLDPNGDTLVTASTDNSIRFWDLQLPVEGGGMALRGISPRALFPVHTFPASGPLRPIIEAPHYFTFDDEEGGQLR